MIALVRLAGLLLASTLLGAPGDGASVAETALAEARAAKQAAYELDAGEARQAALLEAAGLYASVSERIGFEELVRAEAAFRSGEILRAHGSPEGAGAVFERAVSLGENSEDAEVRAFGARALLELGHLARRAKELPRALQVYAELPERFADVGVSVARARGWSVRLFIAEERFDAARGVVDEMLGALVEEPMEALRATDRLAVALAKDGLEPKARDLVAILRQALEPLLDPENEQGADAAKLRLALENLRVTVLLAET